MSAGDRISRHPNSPTFVDYQPYAELVIEMYRAERSLARKGSPHSIDPWEPSVHIRTDRSGPYLEVELDDYRILRVESVDEGWEAWVEVVERTSALLPASVKVEPYEYDDPAAAAQWLIQNAVANGALTRSNGVTEAERRMLPHKHANRFVPEEHRARVRDLTNEAWRDGQHELLAEELRVMSVNGRSVRPLSGPRVVVDTPTAHITIESSDVGNQWLVSYRAGERQDTFALPLRCGQTPLDQVAGVLEAVVTDGSHVSFTPKWIKSACLVAAGDEFGLD